jgi:hypothetical protein
LRVGGFSGVADALRARLAEHGGGGDASVQRGEILLVVGLAVVEVAVFEAMTRLDIVGAARAGETLFILLALNFGFVQVLRRSH